MLEAEQAEQTLKDSFRDSLQKMRNYNNQDDMSTDLSDIFEVWNKVFLSNIRVFSIVSQELFNTNLQKIDQYDEDLTTIQRNIALLMNIPFEPTERRDDWQRFLWKIDDHIELVRVQVSKIYESVQIAEKTVGGYQVYLEKMNYNQNEKFKSLENKQNDLLDKSKELKKKQDKALKKSKDVQKDFIAIMGIFSSILIAAFGGLSALASTFKNINKVSTGKLILMGSFELLAIIMIIFLLLNGISKLSGLNLKSCGCGPEDNCECNVARKHPTLFILTVMLVIVALLGVSDYVIDYQRLLSKMGDGVTFVVVGIASVIIIICSFIYFHDTKKKYPRHT